MKLFFKMVTIVAVGAVALAGVSFVAAAEQINPAPSEHDVIQGARVDTLSAGLVTRVAPGELLPISIKLSNFGGGRKVDVTITYGIYNSDNQAVYVTSETVAVETTASFIKTIQIPFDAAPGKYVAKASIAYKDQLVPATTDFPFTVENKMFGLFQSDFYLYGGVTFLVGLGMLFVGYVFIYHRKKTRLVLFDYSEIPHDKRVFFELLSDTIFSIRQRVGDRALDIAANIDGLIIDKKTGRVLKITKSPSKIIASLVLGYEKALGQKVSFSFRNPQ